VVECFVLAPGVLFLIESHWLSVSHCAKLGQSRLSWARWKGAT
jgi:hypothetical protein